MQRQQRRQSGRGQRFRVQNSEVTESSDDSDGSKQYSNNTKTAALGTARRGAVEATYARRLEEIIQPAVDYLSHATGDLFVKQRIIVPTAGMKAWLLAELATRLGATASHDGIVANVPPMQKMSSDRCRQEAHERRCAQEDVLKRI